MQHQFVLQCTLALLSSEERDVLSVLLPFVLQDASHLYRTTPPMCIIMLQGTYQWLGSPGCSPWENEAVTQGVMYGIPGRAISYTLVAHAISSEGIGFLPWSVSLPCAL